MCRVKGPRTLEGGRPCVLGEPNGGKIIVIRVPVSRWLNPYLPRILLFMVKTSDESPAVGFMLNRKPIFHGRCYTGKSTHAFLEENEEGTSKVEIEIYVWNATQREDLLGEVVKYPTVWKACEPGGHIFGINR